MLTKIGYYKQKNAPVYSFVARIPDLNHVLLRDTQSNRLELWRESRGAPVHSIVVDGVELEFVRDVDGAYRVPDSRFNRSHCPDDIGRIYVDQRPGYAEVVEI